MDISDFLQGIVDNVDVDDIYDAYSHARKIQKISQAISKRYEAKDINRALATFAAKYDYVWFDFSAWSKEDLNWNTTSYVWGIPNGKLTVKADGKTWTLPCTTTLTGSDVCFLYKWCRTNAAPRATEAQRSFRFEKGKYAGVGEVKTVWKGLGAGALAVGVGFLAILASD